MADSLINWRESKGEADGLSDPSPDGSLFNRRIGFHLARKPLTGLSDPRSNQGRISNGSDLLENGLDPELTFGITFRRIGAGLENLGNTCFLNSVLQCLTYTEPLAAYLQSGKHQSSCRTAGFCALCAIQKHVSRALQSTGRILAPKDLVSNLRCISRSFRNARQEDAHEYMVNLLESMHKCCLPSGVHSESPSAYEKSLVHKIFGGNLRSQVKCMQCSFCSNKFDPFLDLSLEILKAESLYKALAHFTAKEQLDGGERHYHCQQCKQKVRALKQLTIHKAPYVLTIHLKRFGSLVPGQKINKKIPFGPTLDLKPFVSGPYDGDLKYTLYGVLVHAGWSTHSGHYYCFVRTSSGMWYSLDDNQVVQVNERKVLEQKAYMLFYVRDRSSFASKKPVDAVKKENGAINPIGRNKAYFNFNQGLKEPFPNGLIDKRLNHPSSSAAVAQREALIAGSSKEMVMKEASNQKIKDLIMAEYAALNKEHILKHSSKLLPLKNSVKGHSVRQNGGECMPQSVLPVKTSTDTGKNGNKASLPDFSGRRSEKIDPVMSVCRTNGDDCQTGGFSQESTGGDSLATKTVDNGHRILDSVPAGSSSLPVSTRISLHKKSSDSGPHRKANKKIMKHYVTGTNLSASILFGSSLTMRKMKHKRSKQCATGIKNLSSKDADCISMDLEPSTSEKFTIMPLGVSAHSRRKAVNSGSKKKEKGSVVNNVERNSNGDLLAGVVNKEFGVRIGQNDVKLATGDRPQKSPTVASAGNPSESRGSNSLKDSRRDPNQNVLMSMLTRGLEETTVARWNEREFYSSQMKEASGVKSLNIGYVADEWDEEYDRGKRKKVKICKNNFGGPNPFQENVSTKAKVMKAKSGSSRSGNQPFRIL